MLSFLPCYILQNINPTIGVPHFQSLALGATSKTYQILGHKTLCEHLKICPDGVKLYLMVKELDIWTENMEKSVVPVYMDKEYGENWGSSLQPPKNQRFH